MQQRQFSLEFSGHSDVLLRVVTLLRRRGCDIRSLTFRPRTPTARAGSRSRSASATARPAPCPPGCANLVEITSVTER